MIRLYKLYIIIVMVILAAVGILTVFSDEKSYSSNENRYLETFPSFNINSFLSNDYQEELANALNDQFISRDNIMQISTEIKKLIGFKDIGGVYIADDGYYITKITSEDIKNERYIQNLRYLQYFASKQKGKTTTIFVPSTGTILRDKLPKFAEFYNEEGMYDTAKTMLSSSELLDIRNLFVDCKNEQIYYKTDHHWTTKGAYIAYEEYCKLNNIKVTSSAAFDIKKVSDKFYGSLYSKVLDKNAKPDTLYAVHNSDVDEVRVIKDGKESKIYDTSKLNEKDKYLYFFGGNYGQIDIETKCKNNLKLLVIKDSFANSFVPFLLDNYSKITMIDPRYYDKSIVELIAKEDYNQTLVLYEISNFAQDTNIYKLIEFQ